MATLPSDNVPGAPIEAHMVKVTNRNSFPFRDMFDGVPIVIAAGATQNIPLEMAQHFFGYPGDRELMKAHTCKRHGWNTPAYIVTDQDGVALADKYFDNLIIKPVVFELVERDENASPSRPIPANAGPDDDEIDRTPSAPQGEPIDQAFGTRAGQGPRARSRAHRRPQRVED